MSPPGKGNDGTRSTTAIDAARLADRMPGARGGRLVGEALAGLSFEEGTRLFAARWISSSAGPFSEVFRFDDDGRRDLIVDSERGAELARWRHRFDSVLVTEIDWRPALNAVSVGWLEGSTRHELTMREPAHLGFSFASAVLKRLPERWRLGRRFSTWCARWLDAGIGLGIGTLSATTERRVSVQILLCELRAGLLPRYARNDVSTGEASSHRRDPMIAGILNPSRPIHWRGELWFVPPPVAYNTQSSTPT